MFFVLFFLTFFISSIDDGFIRFKGHSDKTCKEPLVGVDKCNNEYVVDLPLDVVLGKMPQKVHVNNVIYVDLQCCKPRIFS